MKPKDKELFEAVQNGDIQRARAAIETGANVNASDGNGITALHWAVSRGNISMVTILIINGAEVSPRNDLLETPLHIAARNGHTTIAEILLKNGADATSRDTWQETPLAYAVAPKRQQLVELLEDAARKSASHADRVNERRDADEPHGGIAILRSITPEEATKQLFKAAKSGDFRAAGAALVAGADQHTKDSWGRTPLHWAARDGHADTVHLLIVHGADINAMDNKKRAPHAYAVDSGHADTIALLEEAATKSASHADRVADRRDADQKRQR